MSDARPIRITPSGLVLEDRRVFCKIQTTYDGSVSPTRLASVWLPGGTVVGARTYIHHNSNTPSNYTVQLRSFDGVTTHLSQNLSGTTGEAVTTFASDYTVSASGSWFSVYVTAPGSSADLYLRGILFTVGGA